MSNGTRSDYSVDDQATAQWLSDFKVRTRTPPARGSRHCSGLVFDNHRTTRRGSVVLSFRLGGEEVVVFFNCSVVRQRGKRRGENYRTGIWGQFLPPERGKFRSFWMDTVGKAPRRWAASHKEIRSRLKDLSFEGQVSQAQKSDGTFYLKVTDLQRSRVFCGKDNCDPKSGQSVDHLDPNWDQY